MPKRSILLPKYVFENNFHDLVFSLARGGPGETIELDFERVTYYIPAAITAVLARSAWWKQNGCSVVPVNFEENEAFEYLQRIDFFKGLGLDLEENFARHHPSGNFVPIEEVSFDDGDAERIGDALANCLAPNLSYGSQLDHELKLLKYATGEVVLNCKQHSEGSGFVSAQYAPKHGLIRIGIADCGIGIMESFRKRHSPHYINGMSHAEAIRLAVKPLVSSTTHLTGPYWHSPNMGVGLAMLREMVSQTGGKFYLMSGDGYMFQDGNKTPSIGKIALTIPFIGKICSVGFMRAMIWDFLDMLSQTRQKLGLQGSAAEPIIEFE